MIKRFLGKIKSDELVKGSIVLLVMINLFNLAGYLFHLIIARLLGPEDYGIFAVLMSFVLIYAIPAEAIQTIIAKNTAVLNAKKQIGKIKGMMNKSLIRGIWISVGLFLILGILTKVLFSKILEINMTLIIIANLILFSSFILPVIRGVMQGRKKFFALGWTMLIEAILKIGLGVGLVLLGLRVYGAIMGVVLAVIITFFLSFLFVKEVIKTRADKTRVGINYKNISVWLALAVVLLIFSSDIIIAKILFTPEIAGKYAVLSMIGKMIFYGTNGISKAMLPITAQKHAEKKDSRRVFKKSLIITIALCLIALIVIAIFPELLIRILFGNVYSDVYGTLLYVAIAFSILSITNLVLLYGISKNKFSIRDNNKLGTMKVLLGGIILLAVMILLEYKILKYYSESIKTFSLAFIAFNMIILLISTGVTWGKK
ncbi:hypothetical protein COU61_00205 [Candidatus Pacearchaeota archaeon CG10_big_fil_rev_8_21_14_0_10_35_13]|nr:MAG: hypothetical protein COU61_00205 [Candidatus Pacearchaeota archaeon CG10_big_fil_rev_8_21_14_0_10_35_13]